MEKLNPIELCLFRHVTKEWQFSERETFSTVPVWEKLWLSFSGERFQFLNQVLFAVLVLTLTPWHNIRRETSPPISSRAEKKELRFCVSDLLEIISLFLIYAVLVSGPT